MRQQEPRLCLDSILDIFTIILNQNQESFNNGHQRVEKQASVGGQFTFKSQS